MFDLGSATDMVSKVAGDNFDLKEIITDKFVNENTKLGSVKELLEKVGIDSFDNIQEKIPQLDSVLSNFSDFGSWKDFVAKAAGSFLNK
ncbi:MAG: hypothetical protein KGV57_02815 [Fusobacterium sp.]|nr:hypothetical protein [Fusobacterium sp.]